MNTFHFSSRHWLACISLLACAFVSSAFAQADPPGRIGRIALLSGSASLYNPNTGESFSAPLNQPLTSGDILSTDRGSRIEIQIGSMAVRLDSASSLELTQIDDERVRLLLHGGSAIAKLDSRETLDDFLLETRDGRFVARTTGIFRFDAEDKGTTGTSYYGVLRFEGRNDTTDIGAGQSMRFWPSFESRYSQSNAIHDDFTRWSAARDQRLAAGSSSRYVSPEMTGASDLDAHGQWTEVPEYGAIWYPRGIAADWAPYRHGHWAWVEPWGWTWVGHEAWGFAPFHYGRWVRHHGAWGWVPGARLSRPVYAPALVAWTSAPGISLSVSIGRAPTVGWFPLAPREIYVPIYRSSEHHVRRVNATHVSTITNVTHIVSNPHEAMRHTRYAHREAPHAVTQSPASIFSAPHAKRTPATHATAPNTRDAVTHNAAPPTRPQTTSQTITPAPHSQPHETRDEARYTKRNEPPQRPNWPERDQARMENRPSSNAPVLPSPNTPAQAGTPSRNERAIPETSPSRTEARNERSEIRPVEAPAAVNPPAAMPRPAPQNEARQRPERNEQQDRPFARSVGETTVATPVPRPSMAMPSVPRVERQPSEASHPVVSTRTATVEPRLQERPMHRESRPEPLPQPVRQNPPAPVEVRSPVPTPAVREMRAETRAEAPREVRQEPSRAINRPPEPRAEARQQRVEEPRRQEREERSRDHRPRNEPDKR